MNKYAILQTLKNLVQAIEAEDCEVRVTGSDAGISRFERAFEHAEELLYQEGTIHRPTPDVQVIR